jgi:undecaprenyl-diphosphatase
MLNIIYSIDTFLLLLINQSLQNDLFDLILSFVTDLHKSNAFQISILLFWLFLMKFNRRAFFIGLGLIVTLACSDFLGGLVKNYFMRPRPDLAGIDVILRAPHFGGGSFPSNHSQNMFCLYQFVTYFYPRAKHYLLAFALTIAFSRVYCGVHFPSDVIAGAGFGLLIGTIGSRLVQKAFTAFKVTT